NGNKKIRKNNCTKSRCAFMRRQITLYCFVASNLKGFAVSIAQALILALALAVYPHGAFANDLSAREDEAPETTSTNDSGVCTRVLSEKVFNFNEANIFTGIRALAKLYVDVTTRRYS